VQDKDPSSDLEILKQKYLNQVNFLAGDVLEIKTHKRALTHRAETCVLMTNKNSKTANE